jgi:hypothetical protein
MNRMKIMVMSALLLVAFASLAHAGTPGVNKRQANQRARIHHGVVNGELTRHEAVRLRAGQRHIRRVERRAKADGVVSARERAHLHRMQNHESGKIWRLKHNGRNR